MRIITHGHGSHQEHRPDHRDDQVVTAQMLQAGRSLVSNALGLPDRDRNGIPDELEAGSRQDRAVGSGPFLRLTDGPSRSGDADTGPHDAARHAADMAPRDLFGRQEINGTGGARSEVSTPAFHISSKQDLSGESFISETRLELAEVFREWRGPYERLVAA